MTPQEAKALMEYWEQTLTEAEQLRIGDLERIAVYLSPKVDLPWYVTPNYENLPNEILRELADRLPTLPPCTLNDQKTFIFNWYKGLSDETKNYYVFRWERVGDKSYEAFYHLLKIGEFLSRTKKKAEKEARKQEHFKEKPRGPSVENETHQGSGG